MTEVNGTEFDPLSIMLYFYPKEITNDNKGTSMNLRLSKLDILYLNTLYPGSPEINKKVEDSNLFYYRIYGEYIFPSSTTLAPTKITPITTICPTLKPTVCPKCEVCPTLVPKSSSKTEYLIFNTIGVLLITFCILFFIYILKNIVIL